MTLVRELPEDCKELLNKLKELGFEIRNYYYDTVIDHCIIDFIDSYTKFVIESSRRKTAIVPYGWYTSSLIYDRKENKIAFNLNRIPKGDTFELYIPEECGSEDGACRVHIYYDILFKKVGFMTTYFKKERGIEFLKNFFFV